MINFRHRTNLDRMKLFKPIGKALADTAIDSCGFEVAPNLEDVRFEQIANEAVTPERRFNSLAELGKSIFLTGAAGTGKTYTLKKWMSETKRRVDLTATTGIAAINVGGVTLHRFCGMQLGPAVGQDFEEYFQYLRQLPYKSIQRGFSRVINCETLIIDEISMLPGLQLNFVDWLFKRLRKDEAPFGGVQVIATGDFLQLPPVKQAGQKGYDWAFNSEAWKAADMMPIVLDVVRRQDEKQFVAALMRFRVGDLDSEATKMLIDRVRSFPNAPPSNITRLVTHNDQKNKWDRVQLENLPGDITEIEAFTTGSDTQLKTLFNTLLTPKTLPLKIGARVMFTVNQNKPPYFVNGEIGTVWNIGFGSIDVKKDSGETISVERFTWRYNQLDPDTATVSQFPLTLAWALTIHKAQGLTLDAAHVDCRAALEPGQAYVAVSRVRTLSGLTFREWPKGIMVSPDAIQFYRK